MGREMSAGKEGQMDEERREERRGAVGTVRTETMRTRERKRESDSIERRDKNRGRVPLQP